MAKVLSPARGLTPANPFPDDCAERFVPVRELGSGGYGAVFLARQVALEREVAVKLLLSGVLTEDTQVERFVNEARITASISHPNVVTLIDFGARHGIPWIVYEYLPGPNLRQILDRGALGCSEAVRAVIQVADGLAAGHERGVIHRDVKPDNVLATGEGRYKVTDFGIAKWSGAGSVRTETGLILGTPAYVSPEQVLGDTIGPASDLYSLGVMLFELLTRKVPFDDPNPMVVLERHTKSQPPRPSSLEPSLPRALDGIVLTALAKSVDARYANVEHFRQELAAILASLESPGSKGTRETVRPPSVIPQRSTVRRLKPVGGGERKVTRYVAVVAAVAGVLLGALGVLRMPHGGGTASPAQTPVPVTGTPSVGPSTSSTRATVLDENEGGRQLAAWAKEATRCLESLPRPLKELGSFLDENGIDYRKHQPPSVAPTDFKPITHVLDQAKALVTDWDRAGCDWPFWLDFRLFGRAFGRRLTDLGLRSNPLVQSRLAQLASLESLDALRKGEPLRAVGPFRRAFGLLVDAETRHRQNKLPEVDELLGKALACLDTDAPPAWRDSPHGLAHRLLIRYDHWATFRDELPPKDALARAEVVLGLARRLIRTRGMPPEPSLGSTSGATRYGIMNTVRGVVQSYEAGNDQKKRAVELLLAIYDPRDPECQTPAIRDVIDQIRGPCHDLGIPLPPAAGTR